MKKQKGVLFYETPCMQMVHSWHHVCYAKHASHDEMIFKSWQARERAE